MATLRSCLYVILGWCALDGTLAAQYPYGSGTAGTSGLIPHLSCGQAWMGNPAFEFRISDAPGGATALLAVSASPAVATIGPASILVDLDPQRLIVLEPVTLGGAAGAPGQGTAVHPVAIPSPPIETLAGLVLYAQVGMFDGTLATTNGLAVELTLPTLMAVATSSSGAQPHSFFAFVDPLSMSPVSSHGPYPWTVAGLALARGGRDLYVSTGDAIRHSGTTSLPPSWTTIHAPATSCVGVHRDRRQGILYTLETGSGSQRQMVALDGDPDSAAFGSVLGTGSGFPAGSSATRTSWDLADLHDVAVVVSAGGSLWVIDTDPASPTWLQPVQSSQIPGATGGSLFTVVDVEVTSDGSIALVNYNDPLVLRGFFRYHLPSGTWLDHNPFLAGIQSLGPSSLPPVNPVFRFGLSRDGLVALTLPSNPIGGIGLLFFDHADPAAFAYAEVALGIPTGSYAAAVPSGDALSIALVNHFSAQFVDAQALVLAGSPVFFSGAAQVTGVAFR